MSHMNERGPKYYIDDFSFTHVMLSGYKDKERNYLCTQICVPKFLTFIY